MRTSQDSVSRLLRGGQLGKEGSESESVSTLGTGSTYLFASFTHIGFCFPCSPNGKGTARGVAGLLGDTRGLRGVDFGARTLLGPQKGERGVSG